MVKVFVNGTFDLLHTGHLDLLNYAKSLGDILIVGIDGDARVKKNKGTERPINNQTTRKTILSNLKAVDDVEIFHTDNELVQLVQKHSPDIMIVGSDWKGKPIIGSEHAKELIFFDRVNNESSTNTLEIFLKRMK